MKSAVKDHTLNAEQTAAVHVSGSAMILAGAGTGKTKVATSRVAHLIECGVPAERIMLGTFTNQAADEMIGRARALTSRPIDTIVAGTMHSLLLRCVLKPFAHDYRVNAFGYNSNTQILNQHTAKEALTAALKGLSPRAQEIANIRNVSVNQVERQLGTLRTRMKCPEDIEARNDYWAGVKDVVTEAWDLYAQYKRRFNYVDFDDIAWISANVLSYYDDIAMAVAGRFDHIMIDEIQDTDAAQAQALLELIRVRKDAQGCPLPSPKFFGVGDFKQSIYGFRGASPQSIETILGAGGEFERVALVKNYRSGEGVVRLFNACANHMRNLPEGEKPLEAATNPGLCLTSMHEFSTTSDEVTWVAEQIADAIKAGECSANDVGVLFRTNRQRNAMEHALWSKGIHYKVKGANMMLDRKYVRDLLAFLNFTCWENDFLAIRRILSSGMMGTSVDFLQATADELDVSMSDALSFIAHGDSARAERMRELLAMINAIRLADANGAGERTYAAIEKLYTRYLRERVEQEKDGSQEKAIESILSVLREELKGKASLREVMERALTLQSHKGAEMQGVTLSTIHGAKGLEFDSVYLIGADDNCLPRQFSTDEDAEEARRLFYVAITRARRVLRLSFALEAEINGYSRAVFPSPFVAEIGLESDEARNRRSALLPDAKNFKPSNSASIEVLLKYGTQSQIEARIAEMLAEEARLKVVS